MLIAGSQDESRCAVATTFRFGSASYATDSTPNISHISCTSCRRATNSMITHASSMSFAMSDSKLTCLFSLFIVGNEWLRERCLLSFANFTSSVSLSCIIVTSLGSFLVHVRINSEYFGWNLDDMSGFRICRPTAKRRLRSAIRHSSVHSSVLLLDMRTGPSTSLRSMVPPYCICSMLVASCAVAIFR